MIVPQGGSIKVNKSHIHLCNRNTGCVNYSNSHKLSKYLTITKLVKMSYTSILILRGSPECYVNLSLEDTNCYGKYNPKSNRNNVISVQCSVSYVSFSLLKIDIQNLFY